MPHGLPTEVTRVTQHGCVCLSDASIRSPSPELHRLLNRHDLATFQAELGPYRAASASSRSLIAHSVRSDQRRSDGAHRDHEETRYSAARGGPTRRS